MSACHVSPLAGHSHGQRTLFRILARFWWPMVNKELAQFIRACVHCQLVNSCSHKSQKMLRTIESDTPFDVVFLNFWEIGDIPDRYGYLKILICLDSMTVFGLGAASGLKQITSDQPARWAFGNFFVPFGFPEMIVVDADGLFAGMSKRMFQETLLIPVHAVSRGNHKAIRNKGFHWYLNKVQNINSADKGSIHQWLQGLFFTLYAWNAGPVDGTDIARSVVAIVREFLFPMDLSLARSMEGTSEGKKALDQFEAASPLLFRQREPFNILVSERRLRHRELRKKGELIR